MPLNRFSHRTQVADRGARSARYAPDWITDELIADTISTWQPYYEETLTEQDAIEMLVNVGRLFDLMEADHAHSPPRNKTPREPTEKRDWQPSEQETFRRARPCLKPRAGAGRLLP